MTQPISHPVIAPHLGDAVVRTTAIEKYFGYNHVLRGIDLDVRRGRRSCSSADRGAVKRRSFAA